MKKLWFDIKEIFKSIFASIISINTAITLVYLTLINKSRPALKSTFTSKKKEYRTLFSLMSGFLMPKILPDSIRNLDLRDIFS